MTDPRYKPFSEYRDKDYRTPRTIRQAYGYDTYLYTEEEEKDSTPLAWTCVVVVLLSFAAYAVHVLWT